MTSKSGLKKFWQGYVALVFIQMPFVQENLVENIPLAKEHNLIMNPFLHDFKVFYPTCSLSRRKFKKMDDDLAPKGQFLGGGHTKYTLGSGIFAKNITLAKAFLPKSHPWLKNLGPDSI